MRRTGTGLALASATLLVAVGIAGFGRQEPAAAPASRDEPAAVEVHPLREAYFGDLHLHTALSFDAFITGTRTLPDDAYRYAEGEAIDHIGGQKVKLRTPLDFMAVTDHSEGLGVAMAMTDPANPLSKSPLAAAMTSTDYETTQGVFRRLVASAASGTATNLVDADAAAAAVASGWQRVIEAAERHYRPGKFTTFIAYEWSSLPNMANLHRNVIFRGSRVPARPFSSADSNRPEDLWAQLDRWRASGDDVIAIPHNSNASKGLMFPLEDSFGKPVDGDYASRRMANEPVTEVTQAKGTSETHTALSPLDELAGFELWNNVVGGIEPVEPVPGSYVRSAYLRGLELEAAGGFNPYRFGLIGATDNHDASSAIEESNFTGGHGNADATAEIRLASRPSTLTLSSLNFSASGIGGVWAESNTREAIFDALRRKETFATSGPRIRVRFFAGWDYPADLPDRADAIEVAYRTGVPMGGDLPERGGSAGAPRFLVWAMRDSMSAPLAKVQIIKGSVGPEGTREAIFDVACSDGLEPDPETRRCPDNGASVDLADCSLSAGSGAAELATVWSDPTWDRRERVFYYARVIENPTCRWSTWDAVRLGQAPPTAVPATIQERAWTSPIWVAPQP